MFQEFQKVWMVYLITSYTVFTLPEPVFSQNNPTGPVYVHSSNGTSSSGTTATSEPTGRDVGTGILEPIALASSHVETELHETLIADASSHHHGRGPPRKHPPPLPRPARRHPPPHPLHHKKPNVLIKKPINFNNKLHVPKNLRDHIIHKHHKEQEQQPHRHQNRERGHESSEMRKHSHHSHENKHHSSDKLARHSHEDNHRSHDKHTRHSHEDSHEHEHKHRKVSKASSESSGSKGTGSSSKRDRSNNEPNRSFIEDEFYRGGNSGGGGSGGGPTGNSVQEERFYSDEKASREVQPTSIRSPEFPYKESEYPVPFPKPPKPVQLSYYYDSDDGKDLKDLIHNHHIRRRKECDGLDNFVYDLEIIAFFLGLIAAGIGLYADVIPFFNEGVKINYNNDLLNPGGDGIDFPHEYWPIKGPTKAHIHKRTIQIGTDEDNQREVLSVAGEFVGGAGLLLSFVGLFPSLIEKFFYSLDWWFGKRGLWKQYLYTYKCEIHPYPQPGWGR